MKLAGLFIVFAGVIFFEVPRMVKDKMWRELAVFSGLMVPGMSMAVMAVMNIKTPNPTKLLNALFNPISDLILALLK